MLKKLVKYGNSYALVLDRTILGLLNMDENSIVKLRIEGDTLMIKSEKETKITESVMLDLENIHARIPSSDQKNPLIPIIESNMRENLENIAKSSEGVSYLKNWSPGTENFDKMGKAFQVIMSKYQEEMKELSSPEFLSEMQELSHKYSGDPTSKELYSEILALRLKYCPNLSKMDEEMRAALLELGYPEDYIIKS